MTTTSLGIWWGEHTMPRIWARGLLRALGIHLEVRGASRVELDKPHVFISNHRSALDPLLLLAALRHTPRFVAKLEVRRLPLIGFAFGRLGHIAIDRSQPEKAREILKQAAQRLGSNHSVYFAPEGTRRSAVSRPTVSDLRSGAFHYAVEVGLPIAPVVIRGTDLVWPSGGLRIQPGRVELEFLPVIPRSSDAEDLRQVAFRALDEAGAWTSDERR
jgi:1-acyl-sn-glycerol-3-phosphate acyltransferase